MSFVANIIVFILSILTGIRIQNNRLTNAKKSLPKLIYSSPDQKQSQLIPPTPFFGEKPHYFSPPSDQEQYRLSSNKPIQSILSKSGDHHVIPYPNDPPHTFPSIKAKSLFTKSPKILRQVYIASADPLERENNTKGTKLKVPLSQLEERFRNVYSKAEKNNLEITINALDPDKLKKWDKDVKTSRVYDYHHGDSLNVPILYNTRQTKDIIEYV
jgi:hypothetical protein